MVEKKTKNENFKDKNLRLLIMASWLLDMLDIDELTDMSREWAIQGKASIDGVLMLERTNKINADTEARS